MSSPWYREGLRFACTQCGDCCTGAPGYVWTTRAEIDELASYLGLSVDQFSRRYLRRVSGKLALIEKANRDCIFYEQGCSVYPVRPRQCRSFPFWPENLRSRSTWEEVKRQCPGTGCGRLYPVEAIRRIRKGELEASGEAKEGAKG